jgi:hypothetical protein
MRDFRGRWESERVNASHRVNIGRYASLEGIPGSIWLYAFERGSNTADFLKIIDGKTGICTIQDLDVGPVESLYDDQSVGYSLEPNRILIGCTNNNDDE